MMQELPQFTFGGTGNIDTTKQKEKILYFMQGDDISTFTATIQNIGGVGQGINIILFGPAIEEGIIEPLSACFQDVTGGKPSIEEVFDRWVDNNKQTVYIIKCDEIAIPEGYKPPSPEDLFKGGRNGFVDFIKGQRAASIVVDIKLKRIKDLSSEVTICFAPQGNEQEGQWGFQFKVGNKEQKSI